MSLNSIRRLRARIRSGALTDDEVRAARFYTLPPLLAWITISFVLFAAAKDAGGWFLSFLAPACLWQAVARLVLGVRVLCDGARYCDWLKCVWISSFVVGVWTCAAGLGPASLIVPPLTLGAETFLLLRFAAREERRRVGKDLPMNVRRVARDAACDFARASAGAAGGYLAALLVRQWF